MRIIYNPKGLTLKTDNIKSDDIVFDDNTQQIRAHGVIYKGTDTTYSNATVSSAGLMSKEDKNVLDTLNHIIEKSPEKQVGVDWGNTGISGLATGTYILQLRIDSSANGISDTYYTGTFTWYAGTPTTELSDEIPLLVIGKSLTNLIYLRTYNKANEAVSLLIAAAQAFTSNATLNFKFKKII